MEGGPSSTPFPGERGGAGHGNLVHDHPLLFLSRVKVEGTHPSSPFPRRRGRAGQGNLVHDQPKLPCLGDELLVGEAFGVLGLLVALPVTLDDVLQPRIVG